MPYGPLSFVVSVGAQYYMLCVVCVRVCVFMFVCDECALRLLADKRYLKGYLHVRAHKRARRAFPLCRERIVSGINCKRQQPGRVFDTSFDSITLRADAAVAADFPSPKRACAFNIRVLFMFKVDADDTSKPSAQTKYTRYIQPTQLHIAPNRAARIEHESRLRDWNERIRERRQHSWISTHPHSKY